MQKFNVLFWLLAGLMLGACQNQQNENASPQNASSSIENIHLFLLIGQSNMAGRGVVEDVDRTPLPNVLALNREGEWTPAVDPIHFDKPIAGVGPGRSFGAAVAAHDSSITVGLIPAAVGGSPISSWEPGALDEATNTHPYDDALARTRRAQQDGVLKAILWHQGESDSHPERAPVYREKLVDLIGRLRAELGDDSLPFFIGQLGQFEPWNEAKSTVDAAHRAIAEELAGVYFVDSDGLDHKGDTLHFSAAAERELGKRYAEAYLEHVEMESK